MAKITPEQRALKVQKAILELAETINEAVESLTTWGPTDKLTLAAWAKVEEAGAVVHRQSRLLAGKSRGG